MENKPYSNGPKTPNQDQQNGDNKKINPDQNPRESDRNSMPPIVAEKDFDRSGSQNKNSQKGLIEKPDDESLEDKEGYEGEENTRRNPNIRPETTYANQKQNQSPSSNQGGRFTK